MEFNLAFKGLIGATLRPLPEKRSVCIVQDGRFGISEMCQGCCRLRRRLPGEYSWQVSSNPCCWIIYVTGDVQLRLLENIHDRGFPTQTAEEYFWVPTHAEYMWQVSSNPLCWWIFLTGEFQNIILINIFDGWVPTHYADEYLWQVSSNSLYWWISVTGEFQPMLLENIYDRCDQNQTAGIVTKSGSVDYSPGRLIKMLLNQDRCTKFWYTWVTQRSSSRVKLRLCLCGIPSTSCSGFKRLSPCETAVCQLNRLMNVEYVWDVFNRGIPKYSEKLLSRFNLVHHKSHSITGLTRALECTC